MIVYSAFDREQKILCCFTTPANSILMQNLTACHLMRGQQRMRWLDSIIDSTDMNLRKLWEIMKDRRVWRAEVHGVAKSWI